MNAPDRRPRTLRFGDSSPLFFRGLTFVLAVTFLDVIAPVVSGYVISNPNVRWPAGEIRFETKLGAAGRTLIDGQTSWDEVVVDAASLWNDYLYTVQLLVSPGSGLSGSRDGTSEVAWSDTVYGQSFGGAIAVAITWSSAGKVVESDILVDESRRWDSFRGPLVGHGGTNDLRRVVAHEFGHSLGLNHPDENGQSVVAIMNSIASYVDEPAADDVTGITSLFPPESIKPMVAFKSPSSGARIVDESVTIVGTASDNTLVERVNFEVNGGSTVTALTTNVASKIEWSALVALSPGTNAIAVHSVDKSGNVSATATRSVFRVVTNVLQLISAGAGTVSPDLDGIGLEIGRRYTVTAIPGAGFIFSNWTGGLYSTSAKLSFIMESNLLLQANFVTNPFIGAAGTFNGLFFETNGVRHESSGSLTMKVTATGGYSGKLMAAGKPRSFSGTFDLSGAATNVIALKGTSLSLTLGLQLTLGDDPSDLLTGFVTDGVWTAALRARRSAFNVTTNPAPTAGAYTAIVVGTNDPALGPAGDGYLTGKIDGSGVVSVKGKLADGSGLTLKSAVSDDGEWPLYVSLLAGKASLVGWITITNRSPDPWGMVSWFKPATTRGWYREGFTNQMAILGSPYHPPVTGTNRVLNFVDGTLSVGGGNLGGSIDFDVTLDERNRVTSTNSDLALTFTLSTGIFKGSFIDPILSRTFKFGGVVLQEPNVASGYFAGTNESGWVSLP